jgi:SAM-dependent methyltransferase
MSIDRNQRTTFEEHAREYDQAVSAYPEMLVEDMIALSGLPSGGRILEIGTGPGNATLAFARRGYHVLGIELGAQLAALAREHCRDFPGVTILNQAFEDWELEPGAFDLVLAADSLHWIPPEIAYPKAARALKPGGSAAFFWRAPVDPGTDWSQEIDRLYRESPTPFVNPDQRFTTEWLVGIIRKNFRASGCFGPVTTRQYTWTETVSAADYIQSLWTFSMHSDIDEATRAGLYNRIRGVIERYGGQVEQPSTVVLFHARVNDKLPTT